MDLLLRPTALVPGFYENEDDPSDVYMVTAYHGDYYLILPDADPLPGDIIFHDAILVNQNLICPVLQ